MECAVAGRADCVEVRVTGRSGSEADWPPTDWESSLPALVLGGVAEDVRLLVSDRGPAVAFRFGAA